MPDPRALRPLGRSGLQVSRLGLGAAALGGLYAPVEAEVAHRVVRRALDLGVRYFDTAPHYGAGASEERLGVGLGEEQAVVSTKVGRLIRPGLDPDYAAQWPSVTDRHPEFDFSADGIRRSLEESLRRLGRDRVDIAYLHDPDHHEEQAMHEGYDTLAALRSEGVVGAIGVGMNQVEMLTRFARDTDIDCVLIAGRYTLLDQSATDDLLPLCQERGIGVVVGGVFNSGILADPHRSATYNYEPAPRGLVDRAVRIEGVCARHDVPLRAAALQFSAGHPAVSSVLTGARSVAELDDALAMFNWPIPDELWAELHSAGLLTGGGPAS